MSSESSLQESASQKVPRTSARLALVVILISLVLTSAYLATESEDVLPPQLGDLALREERSGEAARQMIDRLHGKSVTPVQNTIGSYSGPHGEALLYMSVYAGRDEAAGEERKMADRIREGNAIFVEYEERIIAGHPVAFCRGMGQVHYFFSSGAHLYWLAVDEAASSTAIASLIAHTGTSGYTW